MSRYAPKSVFGKAVYDRRWFLLGWLFGLAFLSWFVGVFYSTFGNSAVLNEQFQQLPPSLKAVAGMSSNFNTVPGYFGSQIFGKTMPMVAAILGIMLGTSLATEEEDGTLQTLLAMPLSRTRVFLGKWLAPVFIFALLMIGLGGGLALSLWQQNLSLNLANTLLAIVNVWVFMVFFFSLTYAVGAAWGRRGAAIAVGSLVALSGYLLNTMAAGVESLKPYDVLSVFHYYGSGDVLEKGLHLTNFSILVGAIVVALVASGVVFARRNIAAA